MSDAFVTTTFIDLVLQCVLHGCFIYCLVAAKGSIFKLGVYLSGPYMYRPQPSQIILLFSCFNILLHILMKTQQTSREYSASAWFSRTQLLTSASSYSCCGFVIICGGLISKLCHLQLK